MIETAPEDKVKFDESKLAIPLADVVASLIATSPELTVK